jgi:uncharacterized tellurite resistance protein B-like protein
MSKQNIHIAMGSLAYAIAKADGTIQQEEKDTIKRLAMEEFEVTDMDTEWIEKMFVKLERDNITIDEAYNYAMDTLEANRYEYDFDLLMKNKCINFMSRIADSFADTSVAEHAIIQKFNKDVIRFL